MSRGFVKEEDQEEAPFIPPRAALPPGVTNYVTPKGHKLLLEERELLEKEIKNLKIENEKERRHAKAVLVGRLKLLNERINSARILIPKDQPKEQVRFGAKVLVKNLETGSEQHFEIVGVDEADVKANKIAFVAPITRAITGKKIGETADFFLGKEKRRLKILDISYPE